MAEERLDVVLGGSSDPLQKALQAATRRFEQFEKGVNRTVGAATKQVDKLQARAERIVQPVQRALRSAQQAFKGLEKAAEKTAKEFGRDSKEYKKVEKAVERTKAEIDKLRFATASLAIDAKQTAKDIGGKLAPAVARSGKIIEQTARGQAAALKQVASAQAKATKATKKGTAASKKAGAAAGRQAKKTKLLVNPLGKARMAILNLRTALQLLAGAAAGQAVVKFASDFELALANVDTLLDNSAVSIGQYREQLDALAKTSSKELIDLTAGLYQTISAGIPQVEGAAGAFAVLEQAQRAAVAGISSTEQAVGAFTTILNAYKDSGITAAEVSDKLFQTVRKGRTTFPELAQSVGRAATVASRAGVSLDELLASIVSLTKAGLSTDEAITQLRRLILGLLKPAKNVQEQFNALGIDFGETALRAKGLVGILAEVNEVTLGSADAFAELFPNVRAMVGAVVLGGTGINDFRQSIDFLKNSAGATDRAFGKIKKTFDTTAKIFKSRLQSVLIRAGDRVLPKLTGVLENLGELLLKNEKLIGSIAKAFLDFSVALGRFLAQHGREILLFFGALASAALLSKIRLLFVTVGTGFLKLSAVAAAAGTAAGTAFSGGLSASLAASNLGATLSKFFSSPGVVGAGIVLGGIVASAIISGIRRAEREALAAAETAKKIAAIAAGEAEEQRSRLAGFTGAEQKGAALERLLTDPSFVVTVPVGVDLRPEHFRQAQRFITRELVEKTQEQFESLGLTFGEAVDLVVENTITNTNARLDAAIKANENRLSRIQAATKGLIGVDSDETRVVGEEEVTVQELRVRLAQAASERRRRIADLEQTKTTRAETLRIQAKQLQTTQKQVEADRSAFQQAKDQAQVDKERLENVRIRTKQSQIAAQTERATAVRLTREQKQAIVLAKAEVAEADRKLTLLEQAASARRKTLEDEGASADDQAEQERQIQEFRLTLLERQRKAVQGLLEQEENRVALEQNLARIQAARVAADTRLKAANELADAFRKQGVLLGQLESKDKELRENLLRRGKAADDFNEKLKRERAEVVRQQAANKKNIGLQEKTLEGAIREQRESAKTASAEVLASSSLTVLKQKLLDIDRKRLAVEKERLDLFIKTDLRATGRALERGEGIPGAGAEARGIAPDIPEELFEDRESIILVGDAMDDFATATEKADAALFEAGIRATSFSEILGTLKEDSEAFTESLLGPQKAKSLAEGAGNILQKAFAAPAGFLKSLLEGGGEDGQTLEQFLEETFRDAGVPLKQALGLATETFGDRLTKQVQKAFGIVPEAIDKGFGETFRRRINTAFEDAVTKLVFGAIEAGEKFADAVVDGFEAAIDLFREAVIDPLEQAISTPLQTLLGSFGGAVEALLDPSLLGSVVEEERTARKKEHNERIRDLIAEGAEATAISEERAEFLAQEREITREQKKQSAGAVLDRTANQAVEFAEKVLEVLPGLLDKFFDLVIEKAPAIVQLAAQAISDVLDVIGDRIDELVGTLVQAFIDSLPVIVDAIARNLAPIVEAILNGILQIVDNLPEIVETLVDGFIKAFPRVFKAIIAAIPKLITAFVRAVPLIAAKILDAIPSFTQAIFEGILDLVSGLVEEIPKQLEDAIGETIPALVQASLAAIPGVVAGFIRALIAATPRLIRGAISHLPMMIEAIGQGLSDLFTDLFGGFEGVLDTIGGFISTAVTDILNDLPGKIADALNEIAPGAGDAAQNLFNISTAGAFGADGALGGGAAERTAVAIFSGGASEARDFVAGFFHKGGRVGTGARNSSLASALSASGAQGFQTGGLVLPDLGSAVRSTLQRDDVVATLQSGEGVLNRGAMGNIGGAGNLGRLNNGDDPGAVFGGGGGSEVTVTVPSTGIGAIDALRQFIVSTIIVAMQSPGSPLRQAAAHGTVPGAKSVRGRN